MKIAITGSHGLVGSALMEKWKKGDDVIRLVRPGSREEGIPWDPATGQLDPARLEGVDAVVHLAGVSISNRWTARQKVLIRESRVAGTSLLSATLAGLAHPPRVLVCASAVGYYGNRGGEILSEDSLPSHDFLGTICQEWEKAARPAVERGIRVVHLRFGVILSAQGGALAKMVPPFKLGLGGRIGDGRQYMSWISIDDVTRAVEFVLEHADLRGAVNVVAPEPVTNQEFTRALGQVLGRPTLFPMPAFAARLAFGEMADALLLASTRAVPTRLQAAGFTFRTPEIESALRSVLR